MSRLTRESVGGLVEEHGRERVFAVKQREQARVDKHFAAGQAERVRFFRVEHVELPGHGRRGRLGLLDDLAADAAHGTRHRMRRRQHALVAHDLLREIQRERERE
jgi:hypothetical protein